MKAIHFDPEIYPDPYRCDLFRFAKLRGSDQSDSKYSFPTVDATVSPLFRATNEKINSVYQYLPFGAGKEIVIRLFQCIRLFWQVDTLVLVGGLLRYALQINSPYGHSPSLR